MILSMTGFGKSICELENKKITIEIKSVNSKGCEIFTRIPNCYKEKDIEVRNSISKQLQRGKIDCSMQVEITGEVKKFSINKALAKEYFNELSELNNEINDNKTDILPIVIKFPEILQQKSSDFDNEEWSKIAPSVQEAIDNITKYRLDEGVDMEKDFILRINNISSILAEISKIAPNRIDVIKERINSELENIKNVNVDQNRFEQELIYYIEKLDITEEEVRLKSHCQYFLDTLNNEETTKGKKLNFISQEIGREINTIGSKANNAEIQQMVVQMKDELEKIKEQTANIL